MSCTHPDLNADGSIIILDRGNSTDANKSFHSLVEHADKIAQTVFTRGSKYRTDIQKIGLLYMGTITGKYVFDNFEGKNDITFHGIEVISGITNPDLNLLRHIDYEKKNQVTEFGPVNYVQSIVCGVDHMLRHFGHREGQLVIYVLTDGRGNLTRIHEAITVAKKLTGSRFSVRFILDSCIAFADKLQLDGSNSNLESAIQHVEQVISNRKKLFPDVSQLLVHNQTLFESMVSIIGNGSSVQSVQKANQEAAKFVLQDKAFKQFDGHLRISDMLMVPIQIYSFVKLKSLMKTSQISYPHSLKHNESVLAWRKKTYLSSVETNRKLEEHQLSVGYKYGPDILDVSKEIIAEMIFTVKEPGLSVIGSTSLISIPREYYMNDIDVLEPGCHEADKFLRYLAVGLKREEKMLVCQYVSKAESPPKLAGLFSEWIESRKEDKILMVQLPTGEHIRRYPFASFSRQVKKLKEEQRVAMKDFVSCFSFASGSRPAVFDLKNPSLSLTQRAVIRKVINPEEIPQAKEDLQPLQALENLFLLNPKALSSILTLGGVFSLRKESGKEPRKTRYWSMKNSSEPAGQIKPEEEDAKDVGETGPTPAGVKTEVAKEEPFMAVWDKKMEVPLKVRRLTALTDFRNMVQAKDMDLLDEALSSMKEIIEDSFMVSVETNNYEKTIECLKALRKCCVDENEGYCYNDFLRKLMQDASDRYNGHFVRTALLKIYQDTEYEILNFVETRSDAEKGSVIQETEKFRADLKKLDSKNQDENNITKEVPNKSIESEDLLDMMEQEDIF